MEAIKNIFKLKKILFLNNLMKKLTRQKKLGSKLELRIIKQDMEHQLKLMEIL